VKTLYECVKNLPDGYTGSGDAWQIVLHGPAGRAVITNVSPSAEDYEIETSFPNRPIRLYYGNPTPQAALDQVVALNTDELISLGKLPASARGNRESTLIATEPRSWTRFWPPVWKFATVAVSCAVIGCWVAIGAPEHLGDLPHWLQIAFPCWAVGMVALALYLYTRDKRR
jgi:hypothetical protein